MKVKEGKFRKSYYKLMQGREGKSMKSQNKDTKGTAGGRFYFCKQKHINVFH